MLLLDDLKQFISMKLHYRYNININHVLSWNNQTIIALKFKFQNLVNESNKKFFNILNRTDVIVFIFHNFS